MIYTLCNLIFFIRFIEQSLTKMYIFLYFLTTEIESTGLDLSAIQIETFYLNIWLREPQLGR